MTLSTRSRGRGRERQARREICVAEESFDDGAERRRHRLRENWEQDVAESAEVERARSREEREAEEGVLWPKLAYCRKVL